MKNLKIPCSFREGDCVELQGVGDFVNVSATCVKNEASGNLDAAGVAEAAGWLLGWLAEHAPEERAKLDTCHSATIAEAIRVERDHLKGNLEAMQRKLGEAESNYLFAQTSEERRSARLARELAEARAGGSVADLIGRLCAQGLVVTVQEVTRG